MTSAVGSRNFREGQQGGMSFRSLRLETLIPSCCGLSPPHWRLFFNGSCQNWRLSARGSGPLTEEVLGLGNLGVPYFKLFRGQEFLDSLPPSVAIPGNVFGNVIFRDIWILLPVFLQLFVFFC